jgi:hypothetical protein
LYINIIVKRSNDTQTAEELLDSRLKPGEGILWKGRPVKRSWTCRDTGKLLSGSVLFSLCAAFFLMLPSFVNLCFDARMKSYRSLSVIGILISLLPITFLLVSSLHLLTSPWRNRRTKRSTRYAFTNQRLITIIRETPLFFPTSQEFRFYAWPIPRRRRIRTFLYKDGTGNITLEYRKGGSFVMEDMEHPREAANILKKLVNIHYASASAASASSVEKTQPVMRAKYSNGIDAPEEIWVRKLKPGEQVLWKSRPAERCWTFVVTRQFLYGTFLLILPLALTLGGWLRVASFPTNPRFNPVFYFFIMGWFCIVLGSSYYPLNAFAAPWKERKRRRNTLYVLTEHRLMMIIDHSIRTYPVRKIKDIRHRPRRNGSGDIILKYGKKRIFKFKDIPNAREAVDILKSFRTAQPVPEREN